jgi:hypothetical protein
MSGISSVGSAAVAQAQQLVPQQQRPPATDSDNDNDGNASSAASSGSKRALDVTA